MERLIPTGECWCGCGVVARRGSFFASGHDKTAEAAVIMVGYGGVADFLRAHGFGPGGRNAAEALQRFRDAQQRR